MAYLFLLVHLSMMASHLPMLHFSIRLSTMPLSSSRVLVRMLLCGNETARMPFMQFLFLPWIIGSFALNRMDLFTLTFPCHSDYTHHLLSSISLLKVSIRSWNM